MRQVFFRNDDLGWMVPRFDRLLNLFVKHDAKLCAAAIPMSCLEQFPPQAYQEFSRHLEVHAHGLTHLDFEGAGKRAEFGQARAVGSAEEDLRRAFELTRDMFGDLFAPVFTPPWNRIDAKLLPSLKAAGFRALSVDGPERFKSKEVVELNVQIDLHTNKKGAPTIDQVVEEVLGSRAPVGIMLHHKYMQENDFADLDLLLGKLRNQGVDCKFMRELIA